MQELNFIVLILFKNMHFKLFSISKIFEKKCNSLYIIIFYFNFIYVGFYKIFRKLLCVSILRIFVVFRIQIRVFSDKNTKFRFFSLQKILQCAKNKRKTWNIPIARGNINLRN